jgi:hypothetical protein
MLCFSAPSIVARVILFNPSLISALVVVGGGGSRDHAEGYD